MVSEAFGVRRLAAAFGVLMKGGARAPHSKGRL